MFNFEGSLNDSLNISESVANIASQRLSDVLPIVVSMASNPTPASDTISFTESLAKVSGRAITDSVSVAEIVSLRTGLNIQETISITEAVVLNTRKSFAETLVLVENKIVATIKKLTESITLTDSSAQYEYPFAFFKWAAACHGGI